MSLKDINTLKNKIFSSNYGNIFFNLSVFFLPSALIISGIFLLIAVLISFISEKKNILKDKWNYPLMISLLLILFSTLNSYINNFNDLYDVDKTIFWVKLLNWIPFFFIFIGTQKYLKTESQRETFLKFLLMGTFPVLLSCIMHFFNINGPFSIFNDSIVWYMKPRLSDTAGSSISGLFNNSNYTATWLSALWPCSLALFIKNKNKYQKVFLIFISFLILIFSILTLSRNAIIGLTISTFFILGIKALLLVASFLLFLLIVLLILNLLTSGNLLLFLESKVPIILVHFIEKNATLINAIINFDIEIIKIQPRIKIFSKTLEFISQKPFLGWGAGSFFLVIHIRNNNFPAYHSHNMPLEIAFNYGIPVSLILTAFVFFLLYRTFLSIFKNKNRLTNPINKSLLASSFVVVIFHLNDVTYYEGKIGIFIWILLSSLKCILEESNSIEKKTKSNENISYS